MALIISAATGNFNAGATWVGGVVPTIGDEAQAANGHTVTITANATCDLISNTGTGIFTLNDGVTLTANVTNKSTTSGRNCLQFTAVSPAVGYIVGNCNAGSVNGAIAVNNTSSGSVNITGNCTGGSATNAPAVQNSAGGIMNITGNCTGGSGSSVGVNNNAGGTLNITGNCNGNNGSGVNMNSAGGTLNIIGNVTGGLNSTSYGMNNTATSTVSIIGQSIGGTSGAGAINAGAGTIFVSRAVGNGFGPGSVGLTAAAGVTNSGFGVVEFQEIEFGARGQNPFTGTAFRLKKANTNVAVFNYCDTAGAKTLIDATQNASMPAATDVRSGVSYASGALTGSCAVPAAGSVALGVPVDATTGTAILSVANVQSALTAQGLTTARAGALDNLDATVSSRLAPNGTLATVTTLTNAPTVPSAAAIADEVRVELATELARIDAPISGAGNAPSAATVATAVRTELATELARVDAAVSSRATAANIPTTDISAIKAKTDALNVDRVNNTATLSQVGNLLAQANS
jgi:hypothetical protein